MNSYICQFKLGVVLWRFNESKSSKLGKEPKLLVADTVQSLINNLAVDGVAFLSFVERPGQDDWLKNNYRLEEYQINSNTTLYAFYHEEM